MEESPFRLLAEAQNKSPITSVLIKGFQIQQSHRLALFGLFLITYAVTFSCNLLIILLIFFSRLLYSPMYMFLSNLSMAEIFFTSSMAPATLHVLLRDGAIFSMVGCFAQFFLFGLFATVECFLLLAMSFDRFLAVCRPLHYKLIMNSRLCLCLILTCWTTAIMNMSVCLGLLKTLHFCGVNGIDHFFCDFDPLLKLSCSDTSIVKRVVSLVSSSGTLFPFFLITVTYGFIIRAIARISSSEGKEKAFSTCSSHLGVVSMYYTTLIIVYVLPPEHLMVANKALSLLYTVMTPLANPFIYTLRNQEIRAAIIQITKHIQAH
ncbi:olfactory receptor 5P55-like [Gastrophryne carolinensis]